LVNLGGFRDGQEWIVRICAEMKHAIVKFSRPITERFVVEPENAVELRRSSSAYL